MSSSDSVPVKVEGRNVVLSLGEQEEREWSATKLDESRILLSSGDADRLSAGRQDGVLHCSSYTFAKLLRILAIDRWAGVLSVDTGYGVKKLFMSGGHLVFASSNLIDDRLGEVIYRENLISLDELTDSAAQVTKATKFGQVLISNKIFTPVDLYQALQRQVLQILRSIFMTPNLYIEMNASDGLAPTQVLFTKSTEDIVELAAADGLEVQEFLLRLRAESIVVLSETSVIDPTDASKFANNSVNGSRPLRESKLDVSQGTFLGDLVELAKEHANVQDLLDKSNLIDIYTVAALSQLCYHGICQLTPIYDGGGPLTGRFSLIKSSIDAYGFILQSVKVAFEQQSIAFPLTDLDQFARRLNEGSSTALSLDDQGMFSSLSLAMIQRQCSWFPHRQRYFVLRIESLAQFVLQLAGDHLDRETAKQLRSEHRTITS